MLRSLSVEDFEEAVERLLLQDLLDKAMHTKIIWKASIFDRPRRDSCRAVQMQGIPVRVPGKSEFNCIVDERVLAEANSALSELLEDLTG